MLSQTLPRVSLLQVVQGGNVSEGIIQGRTEVRRGHGNRARRRAAEARVHVVEVGRVVGPPAVVAMLLLLLLQLLLLLHHDILCGDVVRMGLGDLLGGGHGRYGVGGTLASVERPLQQGVVHRLEQGEGRRRMMLGLKRLWDVLKLMLKLE